MIAPELRDLHEHGRSLIPARADKRPYGSWKAAQRQRASWSQIEAWRRDLNPPLWAGVTGAISDVVTLDFDGPEGCATLEQLGLDPHRSTPGGGYHLDVAAPPWRVPTRNHKSDQDLHRALPGLDVRGDGGYVVLLGATAKGAYTWLRDLTPDRPEVLPDELRAAVGLLHPPAEAPVATPAHGPAASVDTPSPEPAREVDTDTLVELTQRAVDRSGEGRNDAGFWLATQLRDHGTDEDFAREVMRLFVDKVGLLNAKGAVEPYGLDEALASLRQAYAAPAREPFLPVSSGIAEIMLTGQLRIDTFAAKRALMASNAPPRLFLHGDTPVRLHVSADGRARTEPLGKDMMLQELAEAADWYKGPDGDPKAVFPPAQVVSTVLASGLADLPVLEQIIDAPSLRRDGTVLRAAGYDTASGLYLAPAPGLDVPAIPDEPTGGDISAARRLLTEGLLGEFAFDSPASAANAVAYLLTPLLRSVIDGLAPLAVIDAPQAGTGKTYLANAVAVVASGEAANLTPAPDGREDEMRKRITSLLAEGASHVVFDNAATRVDSPTLAQALTATYWQDRLLGVSKTVRLPQRATWALTGNNVQLGGDLPRRCYHIRLDAAMANPWRKHFTREDLLGWASDHRGELIAAVLTLARAWFAAGRPSPHRTGAWGSYGPWARTIGGILTHAGIDGFLANLDQLHSRGDREAAQWAALLQHWLETLGSEPVRATAVLACLQNGEDDMLPKRLAESLGSAPDANSRAQRLAYQLDQIVDRPFTDDGLRVEHAGHDRHAKARLWRVTSKAASPRPAHPDSPQQTPDT